MTFLPFEQAREFARSLNLAGSKEWFDYCRSGQRPKDIPYAPEKVYKEQWKGLSDWLGTGRNLYATKNSGNLLSFEKAREFARSLNLSGQKEWAKYCRSGERPIIFQLLHILLTKSNGKDMVIRWEQEEIGAKIYVLLRKPVSLQGR